MSINKLNTFIDKLPYAAKLGIFAATCTYSTPIAIGIAAIYAAGKLIASCQKPRVISNDYQFALSLEYDQMKEHEEAQNSFDVAQITLAVEDWYCPTIIENIAGQNAASSNSHGLDLNDNLKNADNRGFQIEEIDESKEINHQTNNRGIFDPTGAENSIESQQTTGKCVNRGIFDPKGDEI